VSVPANHLSRFRDLPLEDGLKVKIFGKPKEFTANQIMQAGMDTYPKLRLFKQL